VLADNGWPLDAGRVVGIAPDGLGYGRDGTIWGGELLIADYRGYERAGYLAPVPLPGGTKAILEPWRNTYAQLVMHFGWEAVRQQYPDLDLIRYLSSKPLQMLGTMMERDINSPLSSSCGRLYDAVAAAVGTCREVATYEGQAAIELEALAASAGQVGGHGYPFGIGSKAGSLILDPKPMWSALLDDLVRATEAATLAARFHAGLADAVTKMALTVARDRGIGTVALSGGVFQNKVLLEGVSQRLRSAGLRVLGHRQVPANDGGLSLGQAAIAAALM